MHRHSKNITALQQHTRDRINELECRTHYHKGRVADVGYAGKNSLNLGREQGGLLGNMTFHDTIVSPRASLLKRAMNHHDAHSEELIHE